MRAVERGPAFRLARKGFAHSRSQESSEGPQRSGLKLPRLCGAQHSWGNFRAAEETDHPREVIEAALDHVIQNKVEAAYARSDLFERRRRLMERLVGLLGQPALRGWSQFFQDLGGRFAQTVVSTPIGAQP